MPYKNKEKERECKRLWAINNRDKVLESRRKSADNDRARALSWSQDNPEKNRAKALQWQKDNPGKVKAKNAKRRAAKMQRTPIWADDLVISMIYEDCPEGLHVDHIVPLQGKLVSGLHVAHNLQYLTPEENSSKGNKFNG